MRRMGPEDWSGLIILALTGAVTVPPLFGLTPTSIPHPVWATVLVVFFASLVVPVVMEPTARWVTLGSFGMAVLCSWVLVLGAPQASLMPTLLVLTAAGSATVMRMRWSLLLVVLNSLVLAALVMDLDAEASDGAVLVGFYAAIQLSSLMILAALVREQQMRTELTVAHLELRGASTLLESAARTSERLRIARDLHDQVGHHLTALSLSLEAARHLEGDAARASVERAGGIARDLLAEVRAVVGEIRESPTDLAEDLRQLAADVSQLDVRLDITPDLPVDGESAEVVLRAAQETLTNALRHAGASRLDLAVRSDGDAVEFVALDDGHGGDDVRYGHGLTGLVERAHAVGGTVEIDGSHGFRVQVRVPAR